jgi:cell division protease FtsH
MMGAERRSMVMNEKDKEMTAYHEAGHAIVGRLVPDHDPVYKVSIIPRGRALGVTMYLPEEDHYSISKRQLESQICSLYGGRIAEEITNGKEGVTTGASNDIERATQLARNMVTKWGLSELGAQQFEEEQQGYMGGQSSMGNLSSETARSVDSEIKKILNRCYKIASDLLEANRDKLEMMKDALMHYETIDAEQINDIMNGNNPRPPKGWDDRDSGGGKAEPTEKAQADPGEASEAGSDQPDLDRDGQTDQ